ncbi:MAG: serine hydrolase domain-containing protein [Thermosynechococcaceae cyanobacterium]
MKLNLAFKIGIAIALLLVILTWPVSVQPQPNRLGSLESYIKQELETTRVPGAAIAVIQGNQPIYLQGFGKADPSGRMVTADTPFIMGSLSKSFTALAVMQLVEAGRIQLDEPVQRYLDWFSFADPQASAKITVRQVLNQTTGISWIDGLSFLSSRDASADAIKRRVRALKQVTPTTQPGQTFQYSNVNYDIAGALIEAVTDQPYETYVQEHIFNPLGMQHSFASKTIAARNGLATGYRYWFGQPIADANLPYSRSELASFLLISTAEDMGKYLAAHLNQGRYDSKQILSPARMAELHQGAAATPWGDAYAMGWFDEQWEGVRVLNHFGSFAGYHANMAIAPERNLGLVMLTNAESYVCNDRRWEIAKNAFRSLLGQDIRQKSNVSASCIAPWGIGLLLVFLAVNMMTTVRRVRHWLRYPQPLRISTTILLPFLLHMSLATFLLMGVPRLFEATLPAVLLTTPDAGWLLLLGGIFAFAWGMIRAILMTVLYKKQSIG